MGKKLNIFTVGGSNSIHIQNRCKCLLKGGHIVYVLSYVRSNLNWIREFFILENLKNIRGLSAKITIA